MGGLHRREGPHRKWCFGLAKSINGEPEDATTKTNRWMANMNADRLNITTRKSTRTQPAKTKANMKTNYKTVIVRSTRSGG